MRCHVSKGTAAQYHFYRLTPALLGVMRVGWANDQPLKCIQLAKDSSGRQTGCACRCGFSRGACVCISVRAPLLVALGLQEEGDSGRMVEMFGGTRQHKMISILDSARSLRRVPTVEISDIL